MANAKRLANKLRNNISKRNLGIALISAVCIYVVGAILLTASRAAVPTAFFEPEDASNITSPALVANDGSASGGQALKFGAAALPTDVCPNIAGNQETVPSGMIIDGSGNCVTPPTGGSNPILPASATGCPTFANGMMNFTPPGSPTRLVHVRMDSNASTSGGPLVFAWHGQGTPDQTTAEGNSIFNNLLGSSMLASYTGTEKGILVAPAMHTPSTWDNASSWSTSNRDLSLVDMVVSCAVQQGLVDSKRIHSVGMSWGGYETAHLSLLRSNYIASAVVMSGGIQSTPSASAVQRADNKFAALITHGGSTDLPAVGIVDDTLAYNSYLKSKAQFTILCNHNQGHIPAPDKDSIFEFLKLHPWGVTNAYPGALSAAYPTYCSKQ